MNRTRFVAIAALTMAAAAFPALAAEEPLPKAETVLDRYIQATGGKKAYEKHKTEVATMSMEFVGKGLKGTGTHYADTSNNTIESITIEGVGKIDSGVFNGVAWEANAITGPRILTGAEKADRMREARFNSPLFWREIWKTAETTGMESINGEDCYKVVMTPADGKPATSFYSKKTGLLVKTIRTISNQMGELQVEIYPKNYKDFDGVMSPTKISQQVMGNEIVLDTNDVKYNVTIPPDKFEPPADIKKLMAK